MTYSLTATPLLSEEEWSLVSRLLESRQHDLLAEIRHTDRRAFREELHRQLSLIETLLDKIPVHHDKE